MARMKEFLEKNWNKYKSHTKSQLYKKIIPIYTTVNCIEDLVISIFAFLHINRTPVSSILPLRIKVKFPSFLFS